MGSSPGFGSTECHSIALFGLAFAAPAALLGLKLATPSNSPAHSSIGTPSPPCRGSDCLRAHGFRIFSSPFRGAFHLSLTVLVHYRSPGVLSLGGWSPQLPTEFHVLRGTQVPLGSRVAFAYGALTRSGRPSQTVRLATRLLTPRRSGRPAERSSNPPAA